MSQSQRPPVIVVVIESCLGVALVLSGLVLGGLTSHWTVAFWLVTFGAASAGHGLTWGLGLWERPFFWRAERDERPESSERTRVAAWESVFGAVMLIGGLLLAKLGGVADIVGLALLFLGACGLGHAVLLGLGLARLPSARERAVNQRKHRDDR